MTRLVSQKQALKLGVMGESFIKGSVPSRYWKGNGENRTKKGERTSNGMISC